MQLSPVTNADSIVVATKLSDNQPLLLSHAVAQARSGGTRILLVHVLPPCTTDKKTAPGVVRIASPGMNAEARDALEFAALQLQWQGIICDPVLLTGDPAEQIAAIARARGVHRILVGSSRLGASTAENVSVAERLMVSVDIPVFVLGPQVTPFSAGYDCDRRILLPISLRPKPSAALRHAGALARETGSRITLLHLLDPKIAAAERQRAQMQARMELAALAGAQGLQFPLEIVVREGNVVRSIVDEATCPHRDLILLGSDAAVGGNRREQSLVQQVIEAARCPVITVKRSADELAGRDIAQQRTGSWD